MSVQNSIAVARESMASLSRYVRKMRSWESRLFFVAHQLSTRIGTRESFLKKLRGHVGGDFVDGSLVFKLRPGTWDAWMAHPGHEAETHAWIRANCDMSKVLIDVGAFSGIFSLRYHRTFKHIYCFEASNANFTALVQNIGLCNAIETVSAINQAASNTNGSVLLFLNESDTHSLVGKGKSIEVTATTLDSFWIENQSPKVGVLKVDVEGAEIQVLEGAKSILNSGCVVIAEANSFEEKDNLNDFMNKHGYFMELFLDNRNCVYVKRDVQDSQFTGE